MHPFSNILRLSIGDFFAKTLNFLTFVYLARVLGVESYGVLEFTLSILTYLLLLADGGLELAGTWNAAQGEDLRGLAARIIPLRILMSIFSFVVLITLLIVIPDYPSARLILVLFGLTLFTQAFNLKWAFLGKEKMSRVAIGLLLGQAVFTVMIFGIVRDPVALIWVPVLRLVGDLVMVSYFAWLFLVNVGGLKLDLKLRNAGDLIRPALAMGLSSGLALMMFNFDSILLGFMMGSREVGWYGAAYKPAAAVLLIPVTYFLGIFPALSRTYSQNMVDFIKLVERSLRLMTIFAIPLAIGGYFLSESVIGLLFGSDYSNSIKAMQILCWSAALVILRGTFRQALNASGRQRLDLRCAIIAVGVNIVLNLLLIPRYGVLGAAASTVFSELVWLINASHLFYRYVSRISLLPHLRQTMIGAFVLVLFFLLTPDVFWLLRAILSVLIYLGILLLVGETEVRSWLQLVKSRVR